MNEVLFSIPMPFGKELIITGWKLIGYTGATLFAGRWFVQMLASKIAKKPVIPSTFWYLSVSGSFLTLLYFIIGKNDSIGIIQNFFPFLVSLYNLILDIRHKMASSAEASSK